MTIEKKCLIKMLGDDSGADDGIVVKEYLKGERYEVSPDLAACFMSNATAEILEDEVFVERTPAAAKKQPTRKADSNSAGKKQGSTKKPEPSSDDEKLKAITEAIGQLDKGDKDSWTQSGAPNADKLTDMCGFAVSAQLRNVAWENHPANPKADGE